MHSQYLNRLSEQQRQELINKLWDIQQAKCFISSEKIDLNIHKNDLDIDHVIPLKLGGKDNEGNFALTFLSANRSKQDSDLHVARILHDFGKLQTIAKEQKNTNPNLEDLLNHYDGGKYPLEFKMDDKAKTIHYSFSSIGKNEIINASLYSDKIGKVDYFFEIVPIEFIHHDDIINPRSIGANIAKLVKEFYKQNPQLHIGLAWIDINKNGNSEIKIFDGQHKIAAQLLLGAREVPLRIFVNPDRNKLIETNFNAGTKLKQVAFDKSVQRHLGNTLYQERVERYQEAHQLDDYNFSFSEKDLINFFKGESQAMKRYILDSARNNVIHSKENKLKNFIEFGGKATEKPLSYATVDRTFLSFFIGSELLETNLDYGLEDGSNPRELEKNNIIKLMNIIAKEILEEKFEFEIGTGKIESKIQKGDIIPAKHITAYRMMKEEIIYNWLKYIKQIISHSFLFEGKVINEETLFQVKFTDASWKNIENFVENLADLPIWANHEFSPHIFGGKHNNIYWHNIFATGKSPDGLNVLSEPINIIEMMKPKN